MSGRLDVRVVIKCVHAFCLERLDVKFTIIVLCTLIGFFRKLDVSFVVIVGRRKIHGAPPLVTLYTHTLWLAFLGSGGLSVTQLHEPLAFPCHALDEKI
mgnify:CR=1 FL=1